MGRQLSEEIKTTNSDSGTFHGRRTCFHDAFVHDKFECFIIYA